MPQQVGCVGDAGCVWFMENTAAANATSETQAKK